MVVVIYVGEYGNVNVPTTVAVGRVGEVLEQCIRQGFTGITQKSEFHNALDFELNEAAIAVANTEAMKKYLVFEEGVRNAYCCALFLALRSRPFRGLR